MSLVGKMIFLAFISVVRSESCREWAQDEGPSPCLNGTVSTDIWCEEGCNADTCCIFSCGDWCESWSYDKDPCFGLRPCDKYKQCVENDALDIMHCSADTCCSAPTPTPTVPIPDNICKYLFNQRDGLCPEYSYKKDGVDDNTPCNGDCMDACCVKIERDTCAAYFQTNWCELTDYYRDKLGVDKHKDGRKCDENVDDDCRDKCCEKIPEGTCSHYIADSRWVCLSADYYKVKEGVDGTSVDGTRDDETKCDKTIDGDCLEKCCARRTCNDARIDRLKVCENPVVQKRCTRLNKTCNGDKPLTEEFHNNRHEFCCE